MNKEFIENLKSLVKEVVEREQCLLYDLEFVEGRGRTLRIYIVKPGENIGIEDCANVSRALNLRLDVEDIVPGAGYELEISSPGLERKLRETWHFEMVQGETVKVKVSEPLPIPADYQGHGKTFMQMTGILKAASEAELRIEHEGVEWLIPRSTIVKANTVFVTEKKSKHPTKKGTKGPKR